MMEYSFDNMECRCNCAEFGRAVEVERNAEIARLRTMLNASESLKRGYLDENERLRTDNEDMKRTLNAPIPWLLERDLRAEVERLQGELAAMALDRNAHLQRAERAQAEIERLRAEALLGDVQSRPWPVGCKSTPCKYPGCNCDGDNRFKLRNQ